MNDKETIITEVSLFPGQEDAEQGFPRYRAHVQELTFKRKVIEYANVSTDKYANEKQSIIYDSFSFEQRQKFRNKYEDIIDAINETYNNIVDQIREIHEFRNNVERDFREVLVFDNLANWINSQIEEIEKRPEDNTSIIQLLKSYRSPVSGIDIKGDESGKMNVIFNGFEKGTILSIDAIKTLMSDIKGRFLSIRSFLDEQKEKDLYPLYMKDVETYMKEYDAIHAYFSSIKGNQIRKKPAKSRTPKEVLTLANIERNEQRGFVFPDYSKLEPSETTLNECFRIWKKSTQ